MPSFRGKPACSCLVKWLPAFEAELKRRGVIKSSIDVAQLIGGAPQSGGTHSTGGAFDIWQHDATTIRVAREMGAATWARTRAQGFDPHAHGVLNGCPHNRPARYQIAALAAGYNGLGLGGRGGRDDGPAPRSLRSWEDGIKWAKAQARPVKPARPIKPWFNAAFLNIAGNNSVLAATIGKRADTFLDDATAGDPAVIGFCELRSDQIDGITREMGERGYKRAAYSNMLAAFVRDHVVVRGSSFAKYKRQGKGSKEGMLRVKLTIDGSKCQVGVTHLDYPGKSTSLRVAQMKEGIAALRRYGLATLLPDWRSRTVILTDTNDTTGAVLKAAKTAGFKDAGAGASIDHILVGTKRVMRGASKSKTSSDHPIVRARLGRT